MTIVGLIDVGSNTVRLLVAARSNAALDTICEERRQIGLGEDIELTGRIADAKLLRAAKVARKQARLARKLGAEQVGVVVTAPGRHSANAGALLEALGHATGAPVRLLSAEEEGQLAFVGAVAAAESLPGTVAVCDVGGGSTEIVIGTPGGEPAWVRSLDLGSLQLTVRLLIGDPPSKHSLAAARLDTARCFEGFAPPLPQAALATGGSARGLAKLAGDRLDEEAFERSLKVLAKRSCRELVKEYEFDPQRARTLPAGALILSEIRRRLGVPLIVSRGGMREGAVRELLAERAAA